MVEAGASGYLLKDCDFTELIRAVRNVFQNKLYLSPDVTGVVVGAYKNRSSAFGQTPVSILTSRERELLQLLAEGMKTSKIASHLNISVKTVETHRRNIMEKLNIGSNAELVKYAIREGFTSIER
jgi:DNA-binding NarL/FixJ family response regulator